MKPRYRPRQARASPLWQCLHSALPEFLLHYAERHAPRLGPLLPERQSALERFLRCGDLSQGFVRVRCEDCDHEYLVPFTCKQRGNCPTCHQCRSVDLAATIATEICAPVPHRHWVFTIPQMLRPLFRREPRRLGLLARITADCFTEYLRDRCGLPRASPGSVLAFHTFGDYIAFHPHIHILATAGVFDEAGAFHLVPAGGVEELSETFHHRVLNALRASTGSPPLRSESVASAGQRSAIRRVPAGLHPAASSARHCTAARG